MDAPECHHGTIVADRFRLVARLVFLKALLDYLALGRIDGTQAYTQAATSRRYFVIPPRIASCVKGILWRCRRALYGTPDAAKDWYHHFARVLASAGLRRTTEDPALFTSSAKARGAEEWLAQAAVEETTPAALDDVQRVTGQRLERYAHALETAPVNKTEFHYKPPEPRCKGTR